MSIFGGNSSFITLLKVTWKSRAGLITGKIGFKKKKPFHKTENVITEMSHRICRQGEEIITNRTKSSIRAVRDLSTMK